MTYQQLTYLHLATVLPAFVIGSVLLAMSKGTHTHKALGRIYLVLMIGTGIVTLFMPAHVGPTAYGHFGFIHAFSVLTLYSAPMAYLAARRGDVRTHRENMIGLNVSCIMIAGGFALAPGRLLHTWLFG